MTLVATMARSLAREERREAGRLTALADRARHINETGYAAEFDQASEIGGSDIDGGVSRPASTIASRA